MNNIMTLAFILMLSTSAFAATKGAHILVTVNGLVCDFCARSMEKTFSKKEPVAAVTVDLTTKIVTIDLKDGMTLDDADIKQGVIDAGYDVVSIERK